MFDRRIEHVKASSLAKEIQLKLVANFLTRVSDKTWTVEGNRVVLNTQATAQYEFQGVIGEWIALADLVKKTNKMLEKDQDPHLPDVLDSNLAKVVRTTHRGASFKHIILPAAFDLLLAFANYQAEHQPGKPEKESNLSYQKSEEEFDLEPGESKEAACFQPGEPTAKQAKDEALQPGEQGEDSTLAGGEHAIYGVAARHFLFSHCRVMARPTPLDLSSVSNWVFYC